MITLGKVLEDNKGLGQGFDFMRVALSLAVVGWHVVGLSKASGYEPGAGMAWILSYSVLIMFFGLSGFLIAGSAMRLSLGNFLINRGLRIFPALAVEVMLSALVLGPLFTTMTMSEYFTHPKFFLYFTNLLGFVYYYLPGVFDGGWVNGSIWTVPFEIGCYALISVLIFYKGLSRPWILIAITVLILLIEASLALSGHQVQDQYAHSIADVVKYAPANMVDYLFVTRGSRLIVSFTVGIAFYLYRDRVPFSKLLLLLSLAVIVTAEAIGQWHNEVAPMANVFLTVPVVYVVLFLGLSKLPTLPLFHRGDYSYGIYLYGWPLTQAVRFIAPEYSKNWVFLLVASLIPITIFAAISWHFIEKPILQLRKKFSFVARQRLAEDGTATSPAAPPLVVGDPVVASRL